MSGIWTPGFPLEGSVRDTFGSVAISDVEVLVAGGIFLHGETFFKTDYLDLVQLYNVETGTVKQMPPLNTARLVKLVGCPALPGAYKSKENRGVNYQHHILF